MDIIDDFKEKARANKQKIVLPEGTDPRILKAGEEIISSGTADLIVLGDEKKIARQAEEIGVSIKNMKIINPSGSELLSEFKGIYYEQRKHKGITPEKAAELVKKPLYFGTLLVYTDRVQGMVAGSINATGNVLRPAFQIIKTEPEVSVVSGAFIIILPDFNDGNKQLFIFSDCAVNPAPDSNQLAEIAVSTARTAENLLDMEPVVAMLSFSTKGSASHRLIDRVKEAVAIAREKAPEIKIDGELQADAAIIPEVADKKAPESTVAGRANVLIFPDLQSGNIGYKLVQRMARARAIGPVLQGMAKPVNDLSRGCSVEDIVNLVAITAVQSQKGEGNNADISS